MAPRAEMYILVQPVLQSSGSELHEILMWDLRSNPPTSQSYCIRADHCAIGYLQRDLMSLWRVKQLQRSKLWGQGISKEHKPSLLVLFSPNWVRFSGKVRISFAHKTVSQLNLIAGSSVSPLSLSYSLTHSHSHILSLYRILQPSTLDGWMLTIRATKRGSQAFSKS